MVVVEGFFNKLKQRQSNLKVDNQLIHDNVGYMYQQLQTCYKPVYSLPIPILPHKAVLLIPAFRQIHAHLSYITYILQSA